MRGIRRFLSRRHPLYVVSVLSVGAVLLAIWGPQTTDLVVEYRRIVPLSGSDIAWQAFESRHEVFLRYFERWVVVWQFALLFVLPLAALLRLWAAGLMSRQVEEAAPVDRVAAMNTARFLHTELRSLHDSIAAAIDPDQVELRGLESRVVTVEGEPSPVRGFLRSDVLDYFGALASEELTSLRSRSDQLARRLSELEPLEPGGVDVVDVFADALAQWRDRSFPVNDASPKMTGGHVAKRSPLVELRVTPERFSKEVADGERALVNVPHRYVAFVAQELVNNATRASDQQGRRASEVTVTIHVLDRVVWVYVVDNGPGLSVRDGRDLAHPGFSSQGRPGLGLYICNGLARLRLFSFYLDSGPAGGSVARLMFPRFTEIR